MQNYTKLLHALNAVIEEAKKSLLIGVSLMPEATQECLSATESLLTNLPPGQEWYRILRDLRTQVETQTASVTDVLNYIITIDNIITLIEKIIHASMVTALLEARHDDQQLHQQVKLNALKRLTERLNEDCLYPTATPQPNPHHELLNILTEVKTHLYSEVGHI